VGAREAVATLGPRVAPVAGARPVRVGPMQVPTALPREDNAASPPSRTRRRFIAVTRVRLPSNTGGAPYNCEVKPADVACNAGSDCVAYPAGQCACVAPAFGVNAACGLSCPPPPCPPHACPVTGFLTQDCQLVSNLANVAVDCIDHQCLTRAVAPLDAGHDAGFDWDASAQCHRDASAGPAPQGVCCAGQSDCQVVSQNNLVSCCEEHMCAYCGVK
jgi:hypothetical protein